MPDRMLKRASCMRPYKKPAGTRSETTQGLQDTDEIEHDMIWLIYHNIIYNNYIYMCIYQNINHDIYIYIMIYHDISDMTEQQRLIGKRNCCRLSLRGFALNTATDSLGNELLDCTQFKFLLTSLDQLWILCFRFRRINWMNLAARESQCHVNQSIPIPFQLHLRRHPLRRPCARNSDSGREELEIFGPSPERKSDQHDVDIMVVNIRHKQRKLQLLKALWCMLLWSLLLIMILIW